MSALGGIGEYRKILSIRSGLVLCVWVFGGGAVVF